MTYCIHQPETAIASLQRVLDKERSLLSLLKRGSAIASGSECEMSCLKYSMSLQQSVRQRAIALFVADEGRGVKR
jgi:hypothetical protein